MDPGSASAHSHVLGDGRVADGVRGGGDAGLAAVAAAAAVQAGHVHAVQVLVVLPAAVAQGVVLLAVVLVLAPGEQKTEKERSDAQLQPAATRRSPSPTGEWTDGSSRYKKEKKRKKLLLSTFPVDQMWFPLCLMRWKTASKNSLPSNM